MPAFDVPTISSPSTATAMFSVTFIGLVASRSHVRAFPSATASRISIVSCLLLALPPITPFSSVMSKTTSIRPIGVSMVPFHVPAKLTTPTASFAAQT
jgi:hypothetical protein